MNQATYQTYKNKRILIVSLWPISDNSVGGTERFVIDLSSSLIKIGIDVEVLMLSGKNSIIEGVKYTAIQLDSDVSKFNEYSIKNDFFPEFTDETLIGFAKKIEEQFDVNKFDVIHLNSLLFYRLFKNKNRVFTIHTNPFEFDLNWGDGSFERISRLIHSGNRVDRYNAPSKYYAQYYQKVFGANVVYIPHSIDPGRLISIKSKTTILNELGINNGYNILIPSRLELVQKRQDIGLKAINNVLTLLPHYLNVIFTGVDEQYKDNIEVLRAIVSQSKVSLFFHKFESMADAYTIADLILLPSKSESFGYAALESLTSGKKTIMTDIPSFVEIAEDHPNAYLSSESIENYADAIIKAFNSQIYPNPINWLERYNIDAWTKHYINQYFEIYV